MSRLSAIAIPSSPAIAGTGRLQDGLYAFVQRYALPALAGDNIFFARQNRASLPAKQEEYAVIDILRATRHGSATEELLFGKNDEPDEMLITSLFEYAVQLELYSSNESARQRAMSLANVGASLGPHFFQPYGCSFLYMNDPADTSLVSDAQQYVNRWSLELRLSMPEQTRLLFPGLGTVSLSRLENVDIHHKP